MKKAKRLREKTGNPNIYAAHEKERGSAGRLWKVSLVRPFKFLFTEPVSFYPFIMKAPALNLLTNRLPTFPLSSMVSRSVSSFSPSQF